MTSLAFTAVIGLLTVMMAFVGGMQQLTEKTGQPGNVVVMADGATDEVISNISGSDVAEMESLPEVVRRNGRPMASRETYLIVNQPPAAKSDGRQRQRFLQLRGIEDPQLAATVHGLALLSGSWFSEAGVQTHRPRAARQPRRRWCKPFSARASPTSWAQPISPGTGHRQEPRTARPRRYVPRRQSAMGRRRGAQVGRLDLQFGNLGQTLTGGRIVRQGHLHKPRAPRQRRRGRAKTEEFPRPRLQEGGRGAQVETEYYATLSQTTAQFSYAIAFLATVMSVGGIFGVMNTMFAAISQRVKDIGVLRLLGYARWHILVSFLLESMVIALVGGLVGCGLGCLTDGWTASSMVASQSGGKSVVVQLAVSTNIISTGILLTLLMGLLGGLLPALSAMRMKPLEALR